MKRAAAQKKCVVDVNAFEVAIATDDDIDFKSVRVEHFCELVSNLLKIERRSQHLKCRWSNGNAPVQLTTSTSPLLVTSSQVLVSPASHRLILHLLSLCLGCCSLVGLLLGDVGVHPTLGLPQDCGLSRSPNRILLEQASHESAPSSP